MTSIPYIGAEDVDHLLKWRDVTDALAAGHREGKAELGDLLLRSSGNAILNRAAWIDGLGIVLKSMTIFPGNVERTPRLESIHGLAVLFDDEIGAPRALIDGVLLTKWKTAGDSLLGARLLARPNSKRLLIVGAGIVARSLVQAYREIFPDLERIEVWNRTAARVEALIAEVDDEGCPVSLAPDLAAAVGEADIVSCATMTQEPVLRGAWVQPGTHVDLIGAFTPEMREADDDLLRKAEIFVDSRATTLHDIGELRIPLAEGTITEDDVRGDLYDLCGVTNGSTGSGRSGEEAITFYKNGGGAHLDLMTAKLIHRVFESSNAG